MTSNNIRMDAEYRVIGPPGCGKTTWLGRQVENAVEKNRRVLITSQTKAAAAEINGRRLPIPDENLGTLHSHCFHILGKPELTLNHIEEWNEENPGLKLTTSKSNETDRKINGETPENTINTTGDQLMSEYSMARSRMEQSPNLEARAFGKKYEEWKQRNALMDFQDLIEICLREVETAPGAPDVIFVDEAQDLDAIEMHLIRKWGAQAGYLIVVGDPDQCQPAGTMVETATGPVPIENLNPEEHQVLTWDRHSQAILGRRKAITFEKAERHHQGELITVEAGGRTSRCTPEHRWVIKWTGKDQRHCVTYLMRRENRWRIGWCQLFNSEGTLHLGQRTGIEHADAAWILSVRDDRKDAAIDESILAARYGLVTATFEPGHLTGEQTDRRWDSLDAEEQELGALACLRDHGRDPRFPAWEKRKTGKRGNPGQTGMARVQQVRACNLIPNLMSVPEYTGEKQTRWAGITRVTREDFSGTVHSLRVEPHETYVSDGLITHNCIYSWRGASPEAFITPALPEEQILVLSQSYRVPVSVHRKAISWINQIEHRLPAEYYPRDHQGEVRGDSATWQNPERAIRDAEQHIAEGKSVMFLTTCAYMLKNIIQELRNRNIPFHNPYRRHNGAWNPLAKRGNAITTGERILAFLALSEQGMWTVQDIRRWSDALSLREHLARGARKEIKGLVNSQDGGVSAYMMDRLFSEELMNAGLSGNLQWFQEHLNAAKRDTAAYPLGIALARGPETLAAPPKIIVGTIHCSPGDEPVLTTNGWVKMEDLMPEWHRLPGHSRHSNRMTWGGTNSPGSDGFEFVKSDRHYEGKLVVIEAGEGRTRVTPNHRIPVSLNENFAEQWCCYLMRKGEWWRIGVCTTAHSPCRPGGVTGRLATEQADQGWILSIHKTKREAVIQEAKWQSKYGIPGTTFRSARARMRLRPMRSRPMLSDQDPVEIHEFSQDDVAERVTRLFNDTGLQREEPLYQRADRSDNNPKRKTNGHIFTTAAGNLLPLSGCIDVLTPHPRFQARRDRKEDRVPLMQPATVRQEEFSGTVYGLDIPPHHHYISGGIVVHNSVKGGEADVVYLFPDLSMAGNLELGGSQEQQDSLTRLFYVGMTRSRESLVLCAPSGRSAMDL